MNRRHVLSALAAMGTSGLPARAAAAGPVAASRAPLPVEGEMPSLAGATGWLNSPPLTVADLRGKVVVVEFWTLSCINWLRTLPYVRAWADAYRDRGLVVLGVHTPEFGFEKDVDHIRRAAKGMGIGYPIAIDSDSAVWGAFDNRYWPALYFVDARGRIRDHHFGEGRYARSEAVIRQLLAEAGTADVDRDVAHVEPRGVELEADWADLKSAETYVGYARADSFVSPGGAVRNRLHRYTPPARLRLDQWSLTGDWTLLPQLGRLDRPGGRIAHRFHARDLHLVMGAAAGGPPVRIRVTLDGRPPGADHGLDIDESGIGTVAEPRLYQLVRQRTPIVDRELVVEFIDAGVEAYSFTFG